MQEYLGKDGFVWWTGVVESRYDPLQIGRCKVRCMGWHDEDIDKLPTNDLPWAQPLQPITSAALSGIGTSPTGLIEGSWVVGFFMDGKQAQFPIIMGSIAGVSGEGEVMGTGFRDPTGVYPLKSFEGKPDIPILSRGELASDEEAPTYKAKHDSRLENIPIARANRVDSVLDTGDKDESLFKEDSTYNEPFPRYGGQEDIPEGLNASSYPFNHVTKTESGHVFEVDDTPKGERLHRQHAKGTFEEIQPDGTRVTKIVGENYEICLNGSNIYIKGGQNITVSGDARILTKGNYVHEVEGDYMLTVNGDYIKKVNKNDVKEVKSDVSVNIEGKSSETVGKTVTNTYKENLYTGVKKNTDLVVEGTLNEKVTKDVTLTSEKGVKIIAYESIDMGAVKNLNIAAAQKLNVKGIGDVKIKGDTITMSQPDDTVVTVSVTGTVDSSVDVLGGDDDISLVTHIHSQPDTGADATRQGDTGAPKNS